MKERPKDQPKVLPIRWRPEAMDDLEALRDYVEQEAPRRAAELVLKIFDATELLAEKPSLGRAGRVPRTRELVLGDTPFIVAYRVKDGVLEVLRGLHGARRWPGRIPER